MAKIKARRLKFIPSTHYARSVHKSSVTVRVSRREQPRGGPAFVACATAGGHGHRYISACAIGKNPRVVASRALHKYATALSKRSGAFAGYSRLHRKHRRSRRGSKRRG